MPAVEAKGSEVVVVEGSRPADPMGLLDPESRSVRQLIADAEDRRTRSRLVEAVALGSLALAIAWKTSELSKLEEARLHLLLSELMGALGHRAFERVHAQAAELALEQSTVAGPYLLVGRCHSRLGTVALHAGDLAIAEHHYQQAQLRYESIDPPSLDDVMAGLLDLTALSLECAGLDSVMGSDGVRHLQAAGKTLDRAISLIPDDHGQLDWMRRISELQARMLLRSSDHLPPEEQDQRRQVLALTERHIALLLADQDDAAGPRRLDGRLRLLRTLMSVFVRQGRLGDATDVNEQILEVADNLQRSDMDVVFEMALLFDRTGTPNTPHTLYEIIMAREEQFIAETTDLSGEAVALSLTARVKRLSMKCLALLARHAQADDASARQMLDLVLRRKAVIADAERRFWHAVHRQADPAVERGRDTLRALRNRLSAQLAGSDGHGLWQLIREVENVEQFLSVQPWWNTFRTDPASAEKRQMLRAYANALLAGSTPWEALAGHKDAAPATPNALVGSLATRLPPGSALVEFARVDDLDVERDLFVGTARYWALLLFPGGSVKACDLGDAARLESTIDEQLQVLRSAHKLDAEPQLRAMSQLHDAVWSPFAPELAATDFAFIGSDGALGAVPFGALLGPDGRFLVEKLTLHHLATGRELLDRRPATTADQGRWVVVSDPDYDLRRSTPAAQQVGRPVTRSTRFERLPGGALEAELIRRVGRDRVTIVRRQEASQARVQRLRQLQVLHLATHGRFQQDVPIEPQGLQAEDRLVLDGTYMTHVRALSRPGVALAGANATVTSEGDDDGFLSAFDVIGMDLAGTDLVVLSACATAGGALAAGEGVLGLGRSFRIAGARHVVMSLWNLSDHEARRQMAAFYELYTSGVPPTVALRDVQLTRIRWLRDAFPSGPPPALWAALTVQGV